MPTMREAMGELKTAEGMDVVLAIAMNEWMRRYIEEPERFEAEVTTVRRFLAEEAAGEDPSYGEIATAYLAGIVAEKRPYVTA